MNKNAVTLTLLIFLQMLVPASAGAARGKALFEEHCAACHTIGGGDSVGPDLKGALKRRNAGWLERIIAEPDKLAAENDPDHLALIKKYGLEMPNLGISLENAREILEYLKMNLPSAKSDKPAGTPPGQAAAAGSAGNGGKLFFGTRRLSGGGPACAGCHSLADGNMAAGGTFAVNLFKAFDKLGGAGIRAILVNLPFPVKAAAFRGRAVTEGEIADITAFLEETAKNGPQPGAGMGEAAFVGLLCVIFAFTLIALIWSGRKKKGVKDEILSRQIKTH